MVICHSEIMLLALGLTQVLVQFAWEGCAGTLTSIAYFSLEQFQSLSILHMLSTHYKASNGFLSFTRLLPVPA